jgi:hypothetical protein
MKVKMIKVSNCRECPFANNDNDFGFDWCNAALDKIELEPNEELPEEKRHDNCPLNEEPIVVMGL